MSNVIAMVIAVLIRVESGGDARAVGDGGRAVGPDDEEIVLLPIAVGAEIAADDLACVDPGEGIVPVEVQSAPRTASRVLDEVDASVPGEGHEIVAVNTDPSVNPQIVAKKDGQLEFVVVRCRLPSNYTLMAAARDIDSTYFDRVCQRSCPTRRI